MGMERTGEQGDIKLIDVDSAQLFAILQVPPIPGMPVGTMCVPQTSFHNSMHFLLIYFTIILFFFGIIFFCSVTSDITREQAAGLFDCVLADAAMAHVHGAQGRDHSRLEPLRP